MGFGSPDVNDSIVGATDGTLIGNVGDRMKVNTEAIDVNPGPAKFVKYQLQKFLNAGSGNLAVVGSGATPIVFSIAPPANEIWYLEHISLFAGDVQAMEADRFGKIAGPLTNGLQLQAQVNGSAIFEIFNLTLNGHIANMFVAASIVQNANRFNGICYFRYGMYLSGAKSDFVRWRVRDNLSSNTWMNSSALIWRV